MSSSVVWESITWKFKTWQQDGRKTWECINVYLHVSHKWMHWYLLTQVSIAENESMSTEFCKMGLSPTIWTRTSSFFKEMESDHILHADFPSFNLVDELIFWYRRMH